MPELPEVETTKRGLAPHLVGQTLKKMHVFRRDLRWPIPANLPAAASQQAIVGLTRRAKYLLLHLPAGSILIHLGMSGSLRIVDSGDPLQKHDHVAFDFSARRQVRFHDPRRFGCVLWQAAGECHPLLQKLGPEPLAYESLGPHLFERSRGLTAPVKNFVMDQTVVVGVGNIYASESLFLAGIDPRRPSGEISKTRFARLATCIQEVLGNAIDVGGTTLRDYVNPEGVPGYFAQSLHVYDRAQLPCHRCPKRIRSLQLGQRSTYYCPGCQK
jgi:formamidopyrimidine-DNA glycosylase